MWEQITQADIEQARTALNLRRAETLRRHAEEIQDLDAHLQDIEQFEHSCRFCRTVYEPRNCIGGVGRRTAAVECASCGSPRRASGVARFSNSSSASNVRWIIGNSPQKSFSAAESRLGQTENRYPRWRRRGFLSL